MARDHASKYREEEFRTAHDTVAFQRYELWERRRRGIGGVGEPHEESTVYAVALDDQLIEVRKTAKKSLPPVIVREGACIQCNKTSCFLAFHATCARKERLLMPMKASQGSEAPTLQCFCEKHLPVRILFLLVCKL